VKGEADRAGGDPVDVTRMVLETCRNLEFTLSGICDASPSSHADEVRAWISAGRHGSMEWMERRLEERLDPGVYLPGAASMIVVADRYHDGRRDRIDSNGPVRGRIARYARGRDYHKVLKGRLVKLARALSSDHPAATFRPCVDTAPILEREHAMRAGLGLVGKNTLLIEPGHGSWLLLGAVVSTLRLEPTPSRHPGGDPCGTCTRCIDACPTDAITPFSVDASRCIAYTTIEHRGDIAPDLAASTGDWLFGCDVCQEVCPHSVRKKRRLPLPIHSDYAPRRDGLGLLEVLGWDDAARNTTLEGTAARRATLWMWKRNALVCAGNALLRSPGRSDAEALRARIEAIAEDPQENAAVRRTAASVLKRLVDSGEAT
jgi:epoxyqueuosine reductase